jgi:hypothetical protein
VAILLLLLVALMGPWAFDRVNVPAEYPCSPPFIRLEGDFCGSPISGMRAFFWMVAGFIGMVVGFVTGARSFADSAGNLPGVLFSLMILFLLLSPFISTLRLMRGGATRRGQVYHVAVLGLAVLSSGLLLVSFDSAWPLWAVWGLWLYVGLAASALMLETIVLIAERTASHA